MSGVEHKKKNNAGFTLVEVMIASMLVVLLAGGLYATGLMVLKLTHANRIAVEARLLGIQRLEEVCAAGVQNIAMLTPYPAMTNRLMYGEPVVRTVDVVGHSSNMVEQADLANSAYLEVHVQVAYESPVNGLTITNTFSALVR